MKKIPLTKGKAAIIDDSDFELVSKYKWHLHKGDRIGKLFYAVTWVREKRGLRKRLFLHNLLMDTPIGLQVDHKNHDGLDNQRRNLQVGTLQQNRLNLSNFRNNTSGTRGIYWIKRQNVWSVQIRRNGKLSFFGCFKDKIDAEERVLEIRQNSYAT